MVLFLVMNFENFIGTIPDFPKPGILFRDISPLLKNPAAFRAATEEFRKAAQKNGATTIASIDARGFIFGAALAQAANLPFVMIRKKGKLPGKTQSEKFLLEYGESCLEIQENSFEKTDRVFLIDDVLATGGTLAAAGKLVKNSGAEISGIGVLIELDALAGRKNLEPHEIFSLLHF